LTTAIRRERPDLVHAHWTYEFALGALESGIRTVVTAHDAPLRVLRLNPTPYRAVRTLMAYQVAYRAPCLTAVSSHVAEHFYRYLRYRKPIRVIPNGILPQWFQSRPEDTSTPGEITFACVLNGWGVLKNAKTLLKAFQLVRRSAPESELLLFGCGHGPGEDAERWACGRGLRANVRFRGAVDRAELLAALRRSAQILVHPSLEESFGMTIAEGMALGIPVIAGEDSGAVAGVLDGGRSGLLTDVRSPVALAKAMLHLARSRELRTAFARVGAESAVRKFQMDRVLDAYVEVYRECASFTF
jgi:glycosyltransferase involved in cell wall biosynthesis